MQLCVVFFVSTLLISIEVSSRHEDHGGWVKVKKVSKDHKLQLTFAIRRNDPQWLTEKLMAVSYPSSPEYGNYMNFDEIATHVYGDPQSVETLENTLTAAGVNGKDIDYTLGKDFAVVLLNVEIAERLFQADFYEFQHYKRKDLSIVKTINYTLPEPLYEHLDFISGLSEFPRVSSYETHRKVQSPTQGLGTTPMTINSAYNISGYVSNSSDNSQAVAGFLKQYFNADDLQKFQKKYHVAENKIAKIIGKNVQLHQGVEANLDVQYITAVGQKVKTWFISESKLANKNQEDFLSWIIATVNDTTTPWVHSVSYADYEHSIPMDYQTRCHDEFMKFGVSGRTLLFASGDEGVHCKKERYIPEWPTCSPYVTSVGGTQGMNTAWSSGGGGFSDDFAMPDYQKEAVEAYLNSGVAPDQKLFNATGRAYPDVSAFAVDFAIIFADIDEDVGGTSCATPTFAGVVSLLNDIRLKSGQKTLGFLNPLLYKLKGNGFIDVTKGTNTGASTRGCKGFPATKGWDPASGWGQPNFGLLKSLVLQ